MVTYKVKVNDCHCGNPVYVQANTPVVDTTRYVFEECNKCMDQWICEMAYAHELELVASQERQALDNAREFEVMEKRMCFAVVPKDH